MGGVWGLVVLDSGIIGSKDFRGSTRAEDAQGTPTQSHISSSLLVYEDYSSGFKGLGFRGEGDRLTAEMSCATVSNRCSLFGGEAGLAVSEVQGEGCRV